MAEATVIDFDLIDPESARHAQFLYKNTSASTIPKGKLTLIDDIYAVPIVDVLDQTTEMFVFEGWFETTKKIDSEAWATGGIRLYLIIATGEVTIDDNVGANPYIGNALEAVPTGTTVGTMLLNGRTARKEA
jgi:predicted RecA/RadA family phage recombinase